MRSKTTLVIALYAVIEIAAEELAGSAVSSCSTFAQVNDLISLQSCSADFEQCYFEGFIDPYLCEGCSLVRTDTAEFYDQTDADCACTCCWIQYLQNYCFKQLCSDSNELNRLVEFSRDVCSTAPVRTNIKPYRSNYSSREAEVIPLFASDNNTLYRSLVKLEKEELFNLVGSIFDFESLETVSAPIRRRDESSATAKSINKVALKSVFSDDVRTLLESKETLTLDLVQDIFESYIDKPQAFFEAVESLIGTERFRIFTGAYQESAKVLKFEPPAPENDNYCLESEARLLNYELTAIEDHEAVVEIAGCYMNALVQSIKANNCPSSQHCSCKCSLSKGLTQCIQSYGRGLDDLILMGKEDINNFCEGHPTKILKPLDISLQFQKEEEIEDDLKFLHNLKYVAQSLGFTQELRDVRAEYIWRTSNVETTDNPDSVQASLIIDKCEIDNKVLRDFMQFDLDSCDIRNLYYCKNHYKGNKCRIYTQEKNPCNSACCLQIKMAQCSETHCANKKPIKEFKAIANLVCEKYADPHVTNGRPFPEVEDSFESPDASKPEKPDETEDTERDCGEREFFTRPAPTRSNLAKDYTENNDFKKRDDLGRILDIEAQIDLGHNDDDVKKRFGVSFCEIKEFKPPFDDTSCDHKEVKQCIKEGILNLKEDPEHFCPYCVNDNAYDECRCACCFGKYFSKVCYDPNCNNLKEKLRYKRYVKEICKTKPIKKLYTRESSEIDEPTVPGKERFRAKTHYEPDNEAHSVKFDLFAGYELDEADTGESNTQFVDSKPININAGMLNSMKLSALRANRVHKRSHEDSFVEADYKKADPELGALCCGKGFSSYVTMVSDDHSFEEENVLDYFEGPEVGEPLNIGFESSEDYGYDNEEYEDGSCDVDGLGEDEIYQEDEEYEDWPESYDSDSDSNPDDVPLLKRDEKREDKTSLKLKKAARDRLLKTQAFTKKKIKGKKRLPSTFTPADRTANSDTSDSRTVKTDPSGRTTDIKRKKKLTGAHRSQRKKAQTITASGKSGNRNKKTSTVLQSKLKNGKQQGRGPEYYQVPIPELKVAQEPQSRQVPKLSKRLEIYERDVLYKRGHTVDRSSLDKSEPTDDSTSYSASSRSRFFKTVTRTRTITRAKNKVGFLQFGSPTTTPCASDDSFQLTVTAPDASPLPFTKSITSSVIFNSSSMVPSPPFQTRSPLSSAPPCSSLSSLPSSTSTTSFSTAYSTSTSTFSFSSSHTSSAKSSTTDSVSFVFPSETILPTITTHFTIITITSEVPTTLTTIKTRYRPTTEIETEYEDTFTTTETVYDKTLFDTIAKTTLIRHKDTTVTTETEEVTTTEKKLKTKIVPLVTLTEYEESDQTVTKVVTDYDTTTETWYDGEKPITVTTYEDTLTTTDFKYTVTKFKKTGEVTVTETETETERSVMTKWYPEYTVTDYDELVTTTKTKWYPTTVEDTITATETVTVPSTIIVGGGRATPTVAAANIIGSILNLIARDAKTDPSAAEDLDYIEEIYEEVIEVDKDGIELERSVDFEDDNLQYSTTASSISKLAKSAQVMILTSSPGSLNRTTSNSTKTKRTRSTRALEGPQVGYLDSSSPRFIITSPTVVWAVTFAVIVLALALMMLGSEGTQFQ